MQGVLAFVRASFCGALSSMSGAQPLAINAHCLSRQPGRTTSNSVIKTLRSHLVPSPQANVSHVLIVVNTIEIA